MKIAVTYGEDGSVFQHFGHCEKFKVYTVIDNRILSNEIIHSTEGGHGVLAGFLKDNQVDVLICGGIGGGAQVALAELGIQYYAGVVGMADKNALALIRGELVYSQNATCSHHGEDHECGEEKHGCCGN